MLKVWFWPKHLRTSEYKKYYFQQDGAPPHTSNIFQEWLASKFGQKFLAKATPEKYRTPNLISENHVIFFQRIRYNLYATYLQFTYHKKSDM
jgi:hypothetical protein